MVKSTTQKQCAVTASLTWQYLTVRNQLDQGTCEANYKCGIQYSYHVGLKVVSYLKWRARQALQLIYADIVHQLLKHQPIGRTVKYCNICDDS